MTRPQLDWITYRDRTKSFGELSAMQWLMDKYDPAPLQSFWDGEQLVPINSVSQPVSAWLAANHGQMPTDPAQVLPFAETADERTALDRLLQNIPGMSEEERTALKNHAARLSAKSSGSR